MKIKNILTELKIVNINLCNYYQSLKLLKMRNEKDIRANMFTNHIISLEEHKKWLLNTKKDNTKKSFIVFRKKNIIGYLNISNLKKNLYPAYWAFYISKKYRKVGVGLALEFLALNLFFQDMKLKKICCEVINNNKEVINLHKKFGFKETYENKSFFIREGKKILITHLTLQRSEWDIIRKNLKIKYF